MSLSQDREQRHYGQSALLRSRYSLLELSFLILLQPYYALVYTLCIAFTFYPKSSRRNLSSFVSDNTPQWRHLLQLRTRVTKAPESHPLNVDHGVVFSRLDILSGTLISAS